MSFAAAGDLELCQELVAARSEVWPWVMSDEWNPLAYNYIGEMKTGNMIDNMYNLELGVFEDV